MQNEANNLRGRNSTCTDHKTKFSSRVVAADNHVILLTLLPGWPANQTQNKSIRGLSPAGLLSTTHVSH